MYTIIDHDAPEIEQPKNIKKQLFLHQKKAVYMMKQMENTHEICRKDKNLLVKTNIGIYADKVGAGKTLAMTSLIACNDLRLFVMSQYWLE